MNIALLSPGENNYSETFISAHKKFLEGNIYYYSGSPVNRLNGQIFHVSRFLRIVDIFKGYLNRNFFSLSELNLYNSFRRNKIDLIFVEYADTALQVIKISEKLNLPVIVHFHGYDVSVKSVVKRINYNEIFRVASFVVVVSKKMYSDVLEFGCPPEKLIYNVYGPNEDFLNVEPNFKKREFVAIGRFVDKKAPYYLIIAFNDVLREFPDAKLVIAGTGPLWDTCRNLIKFLKIENSVELPGVIKPSRFRKYLSESMAFVQHSITAEDGDSEGTPLSILEATAAGIPVISTYHGGIPDIVKHGVNGFLVHEHDVQGMTFYMNKILKDNGLAKKMGEAGKRIIKENYTFNRHIQVLNNLIQKSLEVRENGI